MTTTFDNIKHEKLVELFKTTGLDSEDVRTIANLYCDQFAKIKIAGDL